MAVKNTTVFGIFHTETHAEEGVDRLIVEGFSSRQVSVLFADTKSSKEFAHEKNIKAPEVITKGAAAGGAIGGTIGLLAGIGSLAIPGVGTLIAAGPIMGALAGLGVGSTVGGLIGALVEMGIPEHEAKRYEARIKEGGALLSIHCNSSEEVSRAEAILKELGAEDIASTGKKAASTHVMRKTTL
jgi:hypothetical protein